MTQAIHAELQEKYHALHSHNKRFVILEIISRPAYPQIIAIEYMTPARLLLSYNLSTGEISQLTP